MAPDDGSADDGSADAGSVDDGSAAATSTSIYYPVLLRLLSFILVL